MDYISAVQAIHDMLQNVFAGYFILLWEGKKKGLREIFNKPDPQEEKFILTEAIKKAGAYTAKGEHDVALQALVEHKNICF